MKPGGNQRVAGKQKVKFFKYTENNNQVQTCSLGILSN